MRALAVVQARTGGRRFPGKVLADLRGRSVLAHVIARARTIRGVDGVVVACPAHDGPAFGRLGVPLVARTSPAGEDDVLGRFAAVAANWPADWYLRLTGDNPLLAPDLADDVLRAAIDLDGYACSRHDGVESGWPNGLDVEAFPAWALWLAHERATDPDDREHVTPWMRRHGPTVAVPCPVAWPEGVSLTVDTPADLRRVAGILARIPVGQYGWDATYRAVAGV